MDGSFPRNREGAETLSSLQQIKTQNDVFFSALNAGKISYADYEAAMVVQKQREAELRAANPEANQSEKTQPVNPSENPYSEQNLARQTFNPTVTPEQHKTLANQQIPQEERQELFNQLVQQQETNKQNILQQSASKESALNLGLPSTLGEKYDLTGITVPEGYTIADYRERPGGSLQLKLAPKQAPQTVTGTENSLSQQILNMGSSMPTLNLRGQTGKLLLNPTTNLGVQQTNELLGVSKNPLSPVAGLVAAGENLVLNVPRLALQAANIISAPVKGVVDLASGKQGTTQAAINIAYTTADKSLPKPPATLTTSLLSGNMAEARQVLKDPEFAFGSIVPDLIMAGMGVDTLIQLKQAGVGQSITNKLSNIFKQPKDSPSSNLRVGASLDDTERLVNQPLPRSSAGKPQIDIAEANAKINSMNVDQAGIMKKIDTQQKMSSGVVDVDLANRKINFAVEQAKLEQASKAKADYVIKMPSETNLDLSKQINIPGKIDIAGANAKLSALEKQGASYPTYRSVMSQGRTATATASKASAMDKALPNLERLIRQPLPRSVPVAITVMAAPKLANLSIGVGQNGKSTMGLIPKLKITNVQSMTAGKMRGQIAGASPEVISRLNQRNIQTESASAVNAKINQQIGNAGLKIGVSNIVSPSAIKYDALSSNTNTEAIREFTSNNKQADIGVTDIVGTRPNITASGLPKTDTGQTQSTREAQAQKLIIDVSSSQTSSKIKPGLFAFPRGGGLGVGRGRNRRGKWFKTFDPIPLPKQVLNQVTGRREVNVYNQVLKGSSFRKKRRL